MMAVRVTIFTSMPKSFIPANVSRKDIGMEMATTTPRRALPRNRKITTVARRSACHTLPSMLLTTRSVKDADSSASMISTCG